MKKATVILITLFSSTTFAQNYYKVPPTSSTLGYVPVISVETYNQMEWLYQELNNIHINQHDSYLVNNYSQKVDKHTHLKNWFNQHCTGKQSRSACETTKWLNRKNGIEHQSCY